MEAERLLLINLHVLCRVHAMVFSLFTRWSCSSPVLSQMVHGTSSQSCSATTQLIVSHYRESWSTRGCAPMHAESCLQSAQPRNLEPTWYFSFSVSFLNVYLFLFTLYSQLLLSMFRILHSCLFYCSFVPEPLVWCLFLICLYMIVLTQNTDSASGWMHPHLLCLRISVLYLIKV